MTEHELRKTLSQRKKIRQTLINFYNRLHFKRYVGSMVFEICYYWIHRELINTIEEVTQRITNLSPNIAEDRLFEQKAINLYISLKQAGLFNISNKGLSEFDFSNIRIGKGYTVSFAYHSCSKDDFVFTRKEN